MGMAASQARFLSLTARKTNTEYEGQQINQQRTTLANQSANYYNQLMGMTVPTPPSSSDFTKTTYTFTDGALTNTITSMIAHSDGTYRVNYTASYVNDSAFVGAVSPVVTKGSQGNFYPAMSTYNVTVTAGSPATYSINAGNTNTTLSTVAASTLTAQLKAALGIDADDTTTQVLGYNGAYARIPESSGNQIFYSASTSNDDFEYKIGSIKLRQLGTAPALGTDNYFDSLSQDEQQALLAQEASYASLLNSKYGNSVWLVRYTFNSTANTYNPVFYNLSNLKSINTHFDDNGNSESSIQAITIGSAKETSEVKNVKALFEKDSSGRLINVTLNAGSTDEITYSLTTNTSTDQAKYDDAMNQYEFNKAQYDQEIQKINAKIETIQAEDKTLELRLKQLDTEQNAISTEMEAVKKVIQGNVSSTFKTFNA